MKLKKSKEVSEYVNFLFSLIGNYLLLLGGFASFFIFLVLFYQFEKAGFIFLAGWSMLVSMIFSYAYFKLFEEVEK